jgi:hypothetical protein
MANFLDRHSRPVVGHVTLWEAIASRLAQRIGSDLQTADDARRIDILRWVWNTAHFWRHCGRLYLERLIKPRFGLGETSASQVEELPPLRPCRLRSAAAVPKAEGTEAATAELPTPAPR